MIKSIGIDLVEIERFKKDIEKYGDKFVQRILSKREFALYCQRVDKEQFLSGRFAAKEAVIKALGHFLTEKPLFSEIEIINDKTGQPQVELADHINKKINNAECLISISHEKSYATAMVIFKEDK